MTEEQKKSAAAHFKANPKDKKYFVTDDGQCFVNEHDALQHKLTHKHKNDAVAIERSDVLGKGSSKDDAATSDQKPMDEMTMVELKELAAAYPEEEWKGFKSKADMIAYLTSKEK